MALRATYFLSVIYGDPVGRYVRSNVRYLKFQIIYNLFTILHSWQKFSTQAFAYSGPVAQTREMVSFSHIQF